MAAKNSKAEKVAGGGGRTQGNGSPAKQDQEHEAGQALHTAAVEAGRIVEPLKKLMFSRLDAQKEGVVNRLYSISTTIRQVDDGLREQDQAGIAQYGDAAARQLERFTSYLRDKDTSALVHEAGSFAKRNPMIFVGGALALGVGAGCGDHHRRGLRDREGGRFAARERGRQGGRD